MKFKLVGAGWPDNMRGEILPGVIEQINFGEKYLSWTIGNGYEFEVVGFEPQLEVVKAPTGLPALFGQKVKRIEVEFQEEPTK